MFARAKRTLPLKIEAACIVIADVPGSGIKQRIANKFDIGIGHQRYQLEQLALLRAQYTYLLQPQHFGNFIVYAVLCIIQIGMRSIHAQVVFDGLHHTPLHISSSGERLERTECQRMMRNHKIATERKGFIDHIFGNIDAEQNACNFPTDITHLHPTVVEILLQRQRSYLLNGLKYFFYAHVRNFF
jgi:hypothetical protein